MWGGIPSDYNIHINVSCIEKLKEITDTYGLALSLENVPCNDKDPLTHVINLAKDFPDITFTFDTKFAQFHDQMELSYNEDHQWLWTDKRINHIHINDYAGTYKEWKKLQGCQIGEGCIDFDQFFLFLNNIRFRESITMEASAYYDGVLNIEALNRSIAYIKNKMGKESDC